MTDRDFDLLLEEEIAALPPTDDLVEDITPWRTAMNRILIGLGLVTITLNFLLLDTILPAIGHVMLLLGFRALRKENRWFALGYGMSILRTAHFLVWLFLDATIYHEAAAALTDWLLFPVIAANLLQILGLTQGIRTVHRKTGSDAYAGGTTWLLVMNILLTILAFWNYSGFFVLIILIIYILILRTLWDLSKSLDEAGYTVEAAPVRISDHTVKRACTLIIFISLAVAYLFLSKYPMDWQEVQPQSQPELRTELEELGFPGYVLDDLTEEDLLACQGAENVYVQTEELAINNGVRVSESDGYHVYIHTEYPVKELLFTHVAVRRGQDDNWLVFHHFLWQEDPFFRGTEAIKLWPAYTQSEGWSQGTHLSGRVLYDRDSNTYAAPYHSLEERSYVASSFFGSSQTTDLIAAFSMPYRGKNCRGYVCYDMETAQPHWSINSWCSYYYQEHPNYPIQTAADYSMSGFSIGISPFTLRQSALQIWPDELEAATEPAE